MPNQLEITTKYSGGDWLLTSTIADTSDIEFPKDIFLWTLDERGALGEFQSIGHIDQVIRYPIYDSERTNNFGIHLVRYDSSSQRLSSEEDVNKAVTVLKAAFNRLLTGYTTASEPVTELHPRTVISTGRHTYRGPHV